VVGRGVVIGSNVTLKGAYILDNVVIDDKSTIEASIVGSDSHIMENVKISSGCVLDAGVVIGPSVVLEPQTLVASHRNSDEYSEPATSDEEDNFDTDVLGEEAIGYIYHREIDEDEVDMRNLRRGFVDYESPAEYTEVEGGSDSGSELDGSDDDGDNENGNDD
jgi:hypothetical protein